jgi:hypothetical protein
MLFHLYETSLIGKSINTESKLFAEDWERNCYGVSFLGVTNFWNWAEVIVAQLHEHTENH